MVILGGVYIADALSLLNHIRVIDAAWSDYKALYSEKPRLLNELRASIGYGGMIDKFKSYVLEKDDALYIESHAAMASAQSVLRQYRGLVNTPEEREALTEIKGTLDEYTTSIETAHSDIINGRTTSEIDQLARVDDRYAVHGLDVLLDAIRREYPFYSDRDNKAILAGQIRASLGYNGMIHFFRNYILRGNSVYRKSAEDSISRTRQLIQLYRKGGINYSEKAALDAVSHVLDQYSADLTVVSRLIDKGATPENIAKYVRVDDSRALLGLDTLGYENVLRVNKESRTVDENLHSISRKYTIYTFVVVSLTILLSGFMYLIFRRLVIQPVLEISRVMTEMARGNTLVQISYPENARTEFGEIARALSIFQKNEIKRREMEDTIKRLAMTDPLTGLANRNQLELRFSQMVSLAHRDRRLLAVFALDLDKFKPVNDNLGHAAGDTVLKTIGGRLTKLFRNTDLVVRLGGDEFIIVLFGPDDVESIRIVAELVLNEVSSPIAVEQHEVRLSVSIGIALQDPNSDYHLSTLLKHADQALYQAKGAGRNTFYIYNENAESDQDTQGGKRE